MAGGPLLALSGGLANLGSLRCAMLLPQHRNAKPPERAKLEIVAGSSDYYYLLIPLVNSNLI
ncbi:hypothetical protein [Adhaeribacter radiodurans]|uniref:Uncharacterized protein n=1 Tax=Adhaeribacter radiodurans TaxID=2745197 RepID=A0A7L7LBF7_9BACT|nr:hypothetical protein [Adhaeribacter radiodurans]QMU29885.1 hypothetical protein HUW48_18475 [Adhaeribacter radiodurans]